MQEEQLHKVAYNAHEKAEQAALIAVMEHLRTVSVDALSCLCDSSWKWNTRSWMSDCIIDCANEVLDEKLETHLAI